MKIAIVEDCGEHRSLVRAYVEEWSAKTGKKVTVTEFESGDQFLFHNEDTSDIDVVFLDIQMPGISGVELARRIRESNQEIALIFTTGIDDYIAEGYELEAIHYLMKPISVEKVGFCLDKVAKKVERKEQYLTINGEEDTVKVACSKIWWVSAMGHRVILGIEDGDGSVKRVDAKNTMGEMEQLLQGDMFQKTHRSYLVNLSHVCNITKTDVVMDNQDRIPLSRRMYQQVNEGFIGFYRGKQGEE